MGGVQAITGFDFDGVFIHDVHLSSKLWRFPCVGQTCRDLITICSRSLVRPDMPFVVITGRESRWISRLALRLFFLRNRISPQKVLMNTDGFKRALKFKGRAICEENLEVYFESDDWQAGKLSKMCPSCEVHIGYTKGV